MNQPAYTKLIARHFPDATLSAVARLTGGVSADVYQLDLKLANGKSQSVVLRVHGATYSGHPAELEFQLLQSLHQLGLRTPKPLVLDRTGQDLPDAYVIMEFAKGSTSIPDEQQNQHMELMADELLNIHQQPTTDLPPLPIRNDPLPEIFDFLPKDAEWNSLADYLKRQRDTAYTGQPKLLHGDFWPGNVLWDGSAISAILDWEDAALGDPLSDVACSRVELRYKFGTAGMDLFTEAYAKHQPIDHKRLALWQVYVASAANRFMGDWGLEPRLLAHMRNEAMASLREAGATLVRGQADKHRDGPKR